METIITNNMKKYNVKFPLYTFVEFEVAAENEEMAIEIAENLKCDIDQILDNLVPYGSNEVSIIND